MRDQGRLVEWFDDKGYGFIQPQDSTKDRVFLHIKDFSRPGPRPIVGCALEYRVQVDAQGRFRAFDVVYLKAAQVKKAKVPQKSHSSVQSISQQPSIRLLAIGYIIALGLLAILGWLPNATLLIITLINALTYWLYVQDKQAALANARRIPENTLHLVAVLGGWPAAYLAQERLRHKTQKQPFRKIYFCTIAIHLVLLLWWISPLNIF